VGGVCSFLAFSKIDFKKRFLDENLFLEKVTQRKEKRFSAENLFSFLYLISKAFFGS